MDRTHLLQVFRTYAARFKEHYSWITPKEYVQESPESDPVNRARHALYLCGLANHLPTKDLPRMLGVVEATAWSYGIVSFEQMKELGAEKVTSGWDANGSPVETS